MFEWNVSPIIFHAFGPITLRWYGLFFAIGFFFAYRIVKNAMLRENKPSEKLDNLLMYVIVGTVVGARLGHCFFYNADYYLSHPLEVLYVHKGGLASHGGAIGIVTSIFLFSLRNKEFGFAWLVDRVALTVPLCGGLVRLGNLMNSEIYGKPTDVPWAFIFKRIDNIPRHPTQLYEAFSYFAIFLFLRWLYKNAKHVPEGAIVGFLFIGIWSARFFIEFFKESHAAFEQQLPLNMGQLLSIPFFCLGLYLALRTRGRFEFKSAARSNIFFRWLASDHKNPRKNQKNSKKAK